MPNVTASASQMSPASTGAVVSVNANEYMPSSAPPMPAIAADRAKIMTFDRLTVMPDASAATSELRTASVGATRRRAHQRVDDERQQAEHDEEQQDLLLQHG